MTPLALFMNNLCISLFMNNLNIDPSLNLIIKDYVLASFLYQPYLAHWHSWKGAKFNGFGFICVCYVSIFTLFYVFCFGVLGVLSVSFRPTVLVRVLLRGPHVSHFAYSWKFQGVYKTTWIAAMEMDSEDEENDGHYCWFGLIESIAEGISNERFI